RRGRSCLLSLCLAISAASLARAQMTGAPTPGFARDPGTPASAIPSALREIGFDQHLNERLPLETEFADESGRPVRLGDYFGSKPVVLAFVYYDCPLLCMQVLNALASALDVLSLQPGKDFEV